MGWKEYEGRRAGRVEAELKECIKSGDFERFNRVYQAHALRYLSKKRRQPLYLMALAAHSEQLKKEV